MGPMTRIQVQHAQHNYRHLRQVDTVYRVTNLFNQELRQGACRTGSCNHLQGIEERIW